MGSYKRWVPQNHSGPNAILTAMSAPEATLHCSAISKDESGSYSCCNQQGKISNVCSYREYNYYRTCPHPTPVNLDIYLIS